MTARAVVLVVLAAALLPAPAARAQSFVQRVTGDACDQARSFDRGDGSPEAQEARRACRLVQFERRLQVEREQQVATQVEERDARVEKWMETTQPARVIHPLALELYTGTGLASYGLVLSYMALSQLEFAVSVGWRTVGYLDSDPSESGTADYKDRTLAFTSRWFASGTRNLSPFVGAGLASTTADLDVFWNGSKDGSSAMALSGRARGHSMSAHAGLQLAVRNLRLSLEYVFQYVFFTGADTTMDKVPSEQMRIVWQETLDHHRHGVVFRVGFAY